tara:strand:- start:2191 stop:2862 length:672 start_codon:yes stop_codon:yes gene_type:complete
MGFLDNSSITVDAILTKRGREILSQGGNFNITKFALSDEEIDYTLYDVTHPDGTDSYGVAIENMSLLEAAPNRRAFNSFLVNQSLAGVKVNVAQLNYSNVDPFSEIAISPTTVGGTAEDYTFTIENTNIVKFKNSAPSRTVTRPSVTLIAQSINPSATTTVTVQGVNSGITNVITVSVKQDEASTVAPDAPQQTGQTAEQVQAGAGSAAQGFSANNPPTDYGK